MSLAEIYPKYSSPDRGGDKGTAHSYIDIYAQHVKPTVKDLLEVGVWEGQSLAMWEEYLPEATVVGLENDLTRLRYLVDARSCDATVAASVQEALGEQMFDVIIDDGSHRVYDQIKTFDILFERLRPHGKYFIEDVQGPDALRVLMERLDDVSCDYTVWDHRSVKNRHDDILVMVAK